MVTRKLCQLCFLKKIKKSGKIKGPCIARPRNRSGHKKKGGRRLSATQRGHLGCGQIATSSVQSLGGEARAAV